jgi:hypothetical protein
MTRKIRVAESKVEPIVFSDNQWESLEKAYGRKLPQTVRDQIHIVTKAFQILGNMEQGPYDRSLMIETTGRLRNAAEKLLKKTGHKLGVGGELCSLHAVMERMALLPMASPSKYSLDELSNPDTLVLGDDVAFLLLVELFVLACTVMLRNWKADPGLQGGSAWDMWVYSIRKAVEGFDFPSGVRNDAGGPFEPEISDFAKLIAELQKHIPERLRRHRTLAALSKAISRACESKRRFEVVPPYLRDRLPLLSGQVADQRAGEVEKWFEKLLEDPNWIRLDAKTVQRVEIADIMNPVRKRQDKPR